MRLYGAICKVTPEDDGSITVEGIASSEAIDEQGEIVRGDAMRDAIPDYMVFPALREMHQLSAAGTTIEAVVDADGMTRIVARVVDPVAIMKVRSGVYRGFSIGGRVTKRDPKNSKIITGITLNEISLVDRPANPEAVMACWKASLTEIERTDDMKPGLATLGDTPAGLALAAAAADGATGAAKASGAVLAAPVQIWACGDNTHTHTAKPEAIRCIEKRAAAGENGGTQWEPAPAVVDNSAAKSAATPPPAELPAETNITENITAQPEIAPASASNDVAKSDMVGSGDKLGPKSDLVAGAVEQPNPIDGASCQPADNIETEAGNSAEKSAVETATAELTTEGAEEAETSEAGKPSEGLTTAEKAAETPTEADQALAKAAEIAERARAALNLPASEEEPAPDTAIAAVTEPTPAAKAAEAVPLDTKQQIRASWAYLHGDAAAAKYDAAVLTALKACAAAAWKEKVDQDGPADGAEKATKSEIWGIDVLGKGLGNAYDLIYIIYQLEDLQDMLQWEAMLEGDGSSMPGTIAGLISQTCAALRALIEEETAEIVAGSEVDLDDVVMMAEKAGGIEALLKGLADRGFAGIASAIEKAAGKLSAKAQAHLDKALECCSQAMKADGISEQKAVCLGEACDHMKAAGAKGKGMSKAVDADEFALVEMLAKAGNHQALMDTAHFCLASMGKGACPASSQKASEQREHLKAAHDNLCLAGAACSGLSAKAAAATAAGADEPLVKASAENVKLVKAVNDFTGLVEQLLSANAGLTEQLGKIDEKVDRIGEQELPPRGFTRSAGLIGLSKAQDNGTAIAKGSGASGGASVLSPEQILKAVNELPDGQDKAFLLMQIAHTAPRPVNVMSQAEMAMPRQ